MFKFISFLLLVLPSLSSAFPIVPHDFDQAMFIEDFIARGPEFNGIARLSNCSGSLFHFEGQPKTDQALILTNGHCVNFIDPGEVYYKVDSSRSFRLYDRDGRAIFDRVRANQLVYATMTQTDMAVYRLTKTYEELENLGVDSLELAIESPEDENEIQVISGYHSTVYTCNVDGIVYELREGDWTFNYSIRYTPQCQVIPGTSGSPIISSDTWQIVGVNNTYNEGGSDCRINNPCEIDENGNKTVIRKRGYGQQTFWLYSCLDENFQVDLDVDGCELPQ